MKVKILNGEEAGMEKNGRIKYIILMLAAALLTVTGCGKTATKNEKTYQPTKEELSYALPKVGEAAIIEAEIEAGAKGTITAATVGSPNTEILQEAGRILGEKGYLLKIEVCEDYMSPNQLVNEGKADCNYYQHKAYLERYNIENGTSLVEAAKIHYEPVAVYSKKLKKLTEVAKGSKVAVPENPTAVAQALWLLQAEGLLTLMSDADMTAMVDDILENPLELEIITMKEEEILKQLDNVELAICHTGYTLKEAMESDPILLAMETKDSLAAQNLAQSVVVKEYPNENAGLLIQVLMSEKMQEFIEKQYQGSIYMMDGMLPEMEITSEETAETEEVDENETEESEEK